MSTSTATSHKQAPEQSRLDVDAAVKSAVEAAHAFRELDQAQVDRIVDAMVRAGVRAAAELAQLAIRETGFGVFEDKVVKNYLATEFLSDYLKDKRSVGVIDEDIERNIVQVAEPIGVVLAITPVTNPTSTVLYKAIVAAKTRNSVIFRPSPFAIRSCDRTVEILREAAEEAGMPAGALQVLPDPAHEVTHYLFKHPGVDFIWVTGGQKIVALANAAGKPGLCVGPGNAPIYLHRTADIKGAVVDILISKTFDASVICPVEQTCIIDDEIYDEVLAEFARMGGQLLTTEQADKLSEFAFGHPDKVNMSALGQQAPRLAKLAVGALTRIRPVPAAAGLQRGRARAGRSNDPQGRRAASQGWPRPHRGRRRWLGHGRGQGHAVDVRAPGAEDRGSHPALPGPPQAGRRVPA